MLEKHNIYAESLLVKQKQIAITKQAIQNEYESKMIDTQLENEQAQSQLKLNQFKRTCLLYTSPSPRDATLSRMPSSA